MKTTIITKFGFAQVGDELHNAVTWDAQPTAYIGWLRTGKRYERFIVPIACCGERVDSSEQDTEYHARRTDPETAHAEMARKGSKATERESIILSALRARGTVGATAKEVTGLTGIPHVSTSTIMAKMVGKGMLANTDQIRDKAMVRIAAQFDVQQGQLL